MTPEGKVKEQIKEILDPFAPEVSYKMVIPNHMGNSTGMEDFTICAYGFYLAVEAKATRKDKLRPAQVSTKIDLEKAGGIYIIIHEDNIPFLRQVILALKARRAKLDER